MTKTEAELSGLTFGCELEYEGIGQTYAARLIAEVTGGRRSGYDNTDATMPDGRTWHVVHDGSLRGTCCESVSPILTIADIPMLEKVVAALKRGGARVNERTGLHIHVGAQTMTPTAIRNLVRTFYRHYHDIPVITTFSICGVIVEMKPQKTRDNSQHFSPYNFFKSSSLSTLHSLMPLPPVSCVLFFSVSTIACRFISVSA